MTFEELDFKKRGGILDGIAAMAHFPNGYSASVVRSPYTYGGEDGLYELAVIHNNQLDYTTPITNDVVGHLTSEEVTELLQQIEALPPKETPHDL